MTATAGSFAYDTIASDPSDPDGFFRNSPPMTAHRPRLEPEPSPPPDLQLPKVSPSPSPGRKASNRKKVKPTQGDAVLVHYLDGGRQPEIAITAGAEPLEEGYVDEEEDDEDYDEDDDEDDGQSHSSSMTGYVVSPKLSPGPRPANGAVDLQNIAGGALAALALQPAVPVPAPASAPSAPNVPAAPNQVLEAGEMQLDTQMDLQMDTPRQPVMSPPAETTSSKSLETSAQQQQQQQQPLLTTHSSPSHLQLQPSQPRDFAVKPVLAMPITPYTPNGPDFHSPPVLSGGLRRPGIMSPVATPNGHGELPPMLTSPTSDTSAHTPQPSLPSIRAQVGDLLVEQHSLEKESSWRRPSLPQSPPGTLRMPGITSPTSPRHPYPNSMPSPALSLFSPYTPYGGGHIYTHRSPIEHGSRPSHHSEPHGMEQTSTSPSSQDMRDRMSIEHMTNSQIGQFVCKFGGCTAAPFQTQYLLNSHANVHSSARPHYCPVKGCPRSEGGKGFKRKNEMIRHGLVHESPGYVCPFCPDREHKYPRPDNLQRHVRVHHVDKDKDDPELRDVLAQRPDGPNRGRRRRGVT